MSLDFPRAWEIAKATAFDFHDTACSFKATKGGVLCDCHVINQHPEKTSETFYGRGGKPILTNTGESDG